MSALLALLAGAVVPQADSLRKEGAPVNEVPLERRFAGQARLVRLLLWKVGDTTDVDACLGAARAAGMIDAADEAFLRTCLEAEESQRTAGTLDLRIDRATVDRLQRCADKLNRADAA